jgi:hypothetical protein
VVSALGGPKTPSGPFNGSDAKLAAATTAAIDNAGASPGLAKPPTITCALVKRSFGCAVQYTIKEPLGLNFGDETILPSTGIFKYAFTDPKVKVVVVAVSGPATTVGGKTSNTPLFNLACDRSANAQIDWSNVSVSGLKQLCDFQQYVNNP